MTTAYRIDVSGTVQGVGFRPFVSRLARDRDLRGWVRNTGGGVEIHVETEDAVGPFLQALVDQAPPAADVRSVDVRADRPGPVVGFEIRPSVVTGDRRRVPADRATCAECRRELLDVGDRRHGYPFVNCTACGPRYTIIESLPYDRARTSMAPFALCQDCAREYADPADRRFHAEPIACPRCGPELRLVVHGDPVDGDPIEQAARLLAGGAVVAVKGLGGYQLACDATDAGTVARLRRRKHRPDKPLAVMVADLDDARRWCHVGQVEASLLTDPAAPIVLLAGRSRLPSALAPGHRRLGVVLPVTPLHHLLARAVGRPLVLTSGNRSEEPIAIDDQDARERLEGVADAFLVHDRRIVARYDDSVAAVRAGAPAVLRRARGYAPEPIALRVPVVPVLAVGADLSSAFCLASGTEAHVSQHIGDLADDRALDAYRDALARLRRLTGIDPEVVVHDLHPDLFSTRLAESTGRPAVGVGHHHAHVASVMAELGWRGPVLGVAFDGFGLGPDGTAWGGELLWGDEATVERVGHLRPVPLAGADVSVHRPGRSLLAHAVDAGCVDEALALLADEPGASPAVGDHEAGDALGARTEDVVAQLAAGINTVPTSSAGRLLDAVAAATGVCRRRTYDGQPAILLEQASGTLPATTWPVHGGDANGGGVVVDTRPLVRGAVGDLLDGRPVADVAAATHRWLADAVVAMVRRQRHVCGADRVVLAGGVFANDLLLDAVLAELAHDGIEVGFARRLPPGDGGLALGQVLVASARGVV